MSLILKRYYGSASKIPKTDFVPKPYKGPTYDEMNNLRAKHLNPALKTHFSKPLALYQGYKQWLYDIDGKRYLDMFGGICTVSVGHSHPKITEAVNEQLNTLGHVSNIYLHPKIHEYAQRLSEKFADDLKVVYFVNSGSEANDLAILLARVHTQNHEILCLKNCYHGMSYETMGLTSIGHFKYPVPSPPGIRNVMCPDVFTGVWGGSNCRNSPVQTSRSCECLENSCSACDNYIDVFKDEIQNSVPKGKLAAFFAESIQGYGGAVQFPKDYIKRAYELVKESGGLFVSDEVQTGFGRTGDHFWGYEMHGIQPDIVTMAKGIGNGYPLAAVVTTPKIAASLNKAAHFNTFGGNPIACATGIAVLDIIEEERLQENSKEIGTHLLLELEKLKEFSPYVGDVRGKGLMIGMELTSGKNKRDPLSAEKFGLFYDKCKELGVLVGKGGYYGNVARIKPPMCVTKLDADFAVEVFKEALSVI